MKQSNVKIFIVLTFLLFLGGCYDSHEFTILTKINIDGSCERTLMVKDINSEDLKCENFPISIDSTWSMTFQVDSVLFKDCEEEKMRVDTTYFYYRKYQSVEELNMQYADTGNYFALLNRSVLFRKKFRWFYTYYKYIETYGNLVQGESLSKYVTEEEYWAMDTDSDTIPLFNGLDSLEILQKKDTIEDKYNTWLKTTFFNVYFDALHNQLKNTEKRLDYISLLDAIEDTLYEAFSIFDLDYDDLYEIADSLLDANGDILALRENKDSLMQDVYQRFDIWASSFFGEPLDYKLLIPGQLTYTNADSLKGDTMQFVFTVNRFLTEDYEMIAETRIINKWTFYASGAVILLALITLIIGRKTKRK
ncbi:MAG: hypothetical protein JXB49_16200 [Bacteroidales bacterium]|nr:hypothetical protein [Bacteroidales bacterium]